MRATHAIVHSKKDLWWFVCGIIVSNAALLGALLYLFLLARFEFDEATARRAVLYLLVFPTTLFLSAVYSESVFLLCIIGAFYHARRGQWWWAGALGGLAALSRPPGIMIFVGLVVEYLLQCEFNWRKIRLNVFALGLPPLCLAGYFGYLRYAEGTATAVLQAQGSWGLGMQNPLRTVASFLTDFGGEHGTVVDLGFTLVFAALAIVMLFRLRWSYAIYSLAYLGFVTMWGSLHSMPRYVLGMFPAIIFLAVLGRNETFHRAYVPISAALAALLMGIFAVWGWVA